MINYLCHKKMINTEVAIIGAGPAGLFAVFECGLLKMKCHLIDYLPQPGGQLSEIYPKKPIYDIPGFPSISAQELIDNLLKQIEPFQPTYTLGERVEKLNKIDERYFILETNMGTKIQAKVVIIAGGLGCFEPRKPEVKNLEKFENGKGVEYIIPKPDIYKDKKIIIAGGGDSALDWTIYLADIAKELTLIHRSESFRGAPDSVSKVMSLAAEGKINLLLNATISKVRGHEKLESVEVINTKSNTQINIHTDHLIPLFGLSPKLGNMEEWALDIEKNAIKVNSNDYSTRISGIYAIGDINTYVNKLKLILCGFHEAAIVSHSAYKYINPGIKYTVKYTTVNGVPSL